MELIIKTYKGYGAQAYARTLKKMEKIAADYREEEEFRVAANYEESFHCHEVAPGSFIADKSRFTALLDALKDLSLRMGGHILRQDIQSLCETMLPDILARHEYRCDAFTLSYMNSGGNGWTIQVVRHPGKGVDVMPVEDRACRCQAVDLLRKICASALDDLKNVDAGCLPVPVQDALLAWGRVLCLLDDGYEAGNLSPVYSRETAETIRDRLMEAFSASRLVQTILRPKIVERTHEEVLSTYNQLMNPARAINLFDRFGKRLEAGVESLKNGLTVADPFKTGQPCLDNLVAQMLATSTTLGYFETVPPEDLVDCETLKPIGTEPCLHYAEEEMPEADARRKMIRALFSFIDAAHDASTALSEDVLSKWAAIRNTPDYYADGNREKGPRLDAWPRTLADQLVAQVSKTLVCHNATQDLSRKMKIRRGRGTSPYAGRTVRGILEVSSGVDCIIYKGKKYAPITASSEWEVLNRLIKNLEGCTENNNGVDFTSADKNKCKAAARQFINENVEIIRTNKRGKYTKAYIRE